MTAATFGFALLVSSAGAAEPAPEMSASDLAAKLDAIQKDGASYVRTRLEIKESAGTTKSVLQLQIKGRRTKAGTELVFQTLWPKERKGEAVLLRKTGDRSATGSQFLPPDTVRPLDVSQMKESLFGSDLSYEDVIEDAFAWDHQEIVGNEAVDRVNCTILESKPGKGERSSYSAVRTWVDTRQLVPLRIEKYRGSGQLARRIDITNVTTDDKRRRIPANLTIRGPRNATITELDGSRITHNVTYTDREFTPDGLKEIKLQRTEAD